MSQTKDSSSQRNSGEKPFIRRGEVDEIKLYTITDYELDVLERGTPALFFNVGITLLSISCSFLIALFTTYIDSIRIFVVFIAVVTGSFLGVIVFTCLRWRDRRSFAALIQRIRNRISDEASEPIKDEDDE